MYFDNPIYDEAFEKLKASVVDNEHIKVNDNEIIFFTREKPMILNSKDFKMMCVTFTFSKKEIELLKEYIPEYFL